MISTPNPTPTPHPLVTVQSPPQVVTIKVGNGKKAKKETVVVVDFSGALNANTADNSTGYEFAPIIKVKATGKGKNHKPATTKLGTPVPVAAALYNASSKSVMLTPRGKLWRQSPRN